MLVLGVVGFILSACTSQDETFLVSPEIAVVPTSYALEDDSGNVLGFATPINSTVLVAPDHLWQASESLYFQNKSIEILARDFRHDLFFFKVDDLFFSSVPTWSSTPPGVGQRLSWLSGSTLNQASVFSARADFILGETTITDTMQLSGLIDPGDSGKPLYDLKNNKTYGMLVATDKLKNVSYFIRSDVVLALMEEYLSVVL